MTKEPWNLTHILEESCPWRAYRTSRLLPCRLVCVKLLSPSEVGLSCSPSIIQCNQTRAMLCLAFLKHFITQQCCLLPSTFWHRRGVVCDFSSLVYGFDKFHSLFAMLWQISNQKRPQDGLDMNLYVAGLALLVCCLQFSHWYPCSRLGSIPVFVTTVYKRPWWVLSLGSQSFCAVETDELCIW